MKTSQKIYVGVNMNFAKYVYGHKEALHIARKEIGAYYVEMVPDIDYGPVFFACSPHQFRAYHREVRAYAESIGVRIPSILTFYRDNVSVTHSNHEIREHAFTSMRAMAAQAGCLGCDVVGASFGTILVDDMDIQEECIEAGIGYWQRWLQLLHREGVKKATLETMSTLREPPATIASAKDLLSRLIEYHLQNSSSTCTPALCCDVGHGAAEPERDSDDDVEFTAWFKAFPRDIVHIHLKNTDRDFIQTWPFTEEYRDMGIIDLNEVAGAIRDYLRAERIYVMVEVPGKRGRLIGERESIRVNRLSFENAKKALHDEGFREDPEDHTWSPT
ncbi:MAG: TIM barrel protein [Candidatus Bathyarchaeia archaeon]